MDQSSSETSSAADLATSTISLSPQPEEPRILSWTYWKQAIAVVTVEPVLFLYMLATFMQYSVFQDLVYQKTCHDNFNVSICEHLNNHTEELTVVQTQASHWILGSTAALTIPSIVVANYLGS